MLLPLINVMPSSRHASLTALQRAPANRSGRRWTLIDEELCMFSFPRSMSSTGEGAYPPRFKDRVVLVTGKELDSWSAEL